MKNKTITSYFRLLPLSGTVVIGLACAITGFQLTQQYAYHVTNEFDFDFSWAEIFSRLLIENMVWVTLSPILLLLGRRIAGEKRIFRPTQIVNVTILVILAMVQNAISLWLYNLNYFFQSGYMRDFFGSKNQSELVTGLFTSVLEGTVIIGVFMALDYQRKLANRERDLAKAKLDALKMQLHPHFLFNTLHSISSMIDIDLKEAQRMITKVGDLLRSMLAHDKKELVTVNEEIDFIRNYLELEQIRFQDRMQIDFKVDQVIINGKVPSLILQPLAENCIKHGVAKCAGESRIEVVVNAYQNGSKTNWLKLEINNSNDQLLQSDSSNGFGIGLRNVEKRLEQSYGEEYYCSFKKINDYHFKSEIRIPLEI